MSVYEFFVDGMTCVHCVKRVEGALTEIKGVEEITTDLETGKVTLSGSNVKSEDVAQIIENLGYEIGKMDKIQ